jgi:hypothetical protein
MCGMIHVDAWPFHLHQNRLPLSFVSMANTARKIAKKFARKLREYAKTQ